jgi:hypothetical protein
MAENHTKETYFTRREAASFLRLSPKTLAIWASTKRYALPYTKAGNKVLYKLTDLENFLEGKNS